jgi:hypothetical protein
MLLNPDSSKCSFSSSAKCQRKEMEKRAYILKKKGGGVEREREKLTPEEMMSQTTQSRVKNTHSTGNERKKKKCKMKMM